jgi:hypothetical protein
VHQKFIVDGAAIGIVEVTAVDELDARMCTKVDAGERLARRLDPPLVQVIVDRVAHQNFGVGGVVVEVTRGQKLHIAPMGAEIHASQRAARCIDPPIVKGDDRSG